MSEPTSPVAWRVVCAKTGEVIGLHRDQESLEEDLYGWRVNGREYRVEPLYAAPGAGDAGALREALESVRWDALGTEPNVWRVCRACGMAEPRGCRTDCAIRAALAPGGRPRCETCGGSGKVVGQPWADPDEQGYNAPCPACAPAAEGGTDGEAAN